MHRAPPPSENWVRTHEEGDSCIESLDGVMWVDAPLPRRLHRCKAQTRELLGVCYTEHCACGAIRFTRRGPWSYKNETRKSRRQLKRIASVTRNNATT